MYYDLDIKEDRLATRLGNEVNVYETVRETA